MPYPTGINRPDLHLNATASGENEDGGLIISEDQPNDYNLQNPRNLKAASFEIYHHGFHPLTSTWDRIRTRWLSWSIDSQELIDEYTGFNSWPGTPPDEVPGLGGSGEVDSWTGAITGFNPGTFDCPGFDIFTGYGNPVVRVIGNGTTSASDGWTDFVVLCEEGPFPDPPDPLGESSRTFRVYWSLKDPWHALDVQGRAIIATQNLNSVFEDITDGTSVSYSVEEGYIFTQTGEGEIEESDKYLSTMALTSRVEANRSEIFFDTWQVLAHWAIPLGGFCLWTINGVTESENTDGQPLGPSQVASNHKTLHRGSYDGNDASAVLIESGEGFIVPAPGFGILTDFNESNLEGQGVLQSWRQIRLFEDMPWVQETFTYYTNDNQIGLTINGLWLPTNAGDFTSWYSIKLIRREDNSQEIPLTLVSSNGPLDGYGETINAQAPSFEGGFFHLKIETDLGYWDSRDDEEFGTILIET